jgi:hypothetical protein
MSSTLSRVRALATTAAFLGLLAAAPPAQALSCLLFPLSCLVPHHKYGEEIQGTVMDIRRSRTIYQIGPGLDPYSPMENHQEWYVWFKVDNTLYQAFLPETVIGMAFGFKPDRVNWIGKPRTLRFEDRKVVGIESAWVQMKRDDGKWWVLQLISIIGPDGIDECGKWKWCPRQAKIDRGAREAEQLAKLQKTGQRSATDVAPAPVVVSEGPAQSAPAPASQPASDTGGGATEAAGAPPASAAGPPAESPAPAQ